MFLEALRVELEQAESEERKREQERVWIDTMLPFIGECDGAPHQAAAADHRRNSSAKWRRSARCRSAPRPMKRNTEKR
jgi:hypothetical protein